MQFVMFFSMENNYRGPSRSIEVHRVPSRSVPSNPIQCHRNCIQSTLQRGFQGLPNSHRNEAFEGKSAEGDDDYCRLIEAAGGVAERCGADPCVR